MKKYNNIKEFLKEEQTNAIRLTFRQIEIILGGPLPNSAREHQAWWANDKSHSHAASWMKIGWKTATPALSKGTILFQRLK